MMRRIATSLVATLGLAATLVAAAPAANAGARDGVCESGEFCLYYGLGLSGSRVDLVNSQRDYGSGADCIRFVSAGTGRNECVKNNAASVWNRTGKVVTVFYNADFGGVMDNIPEGAQVNLNDNVRNDNASQIIGDASLRFPLRTTQAHIKNRSPLTWCWASKTNCHHSYNAADIFAAPGTDVLSPVNGTVMTVTESTTGPGSRLTIKDAHGRLWYLTHMHHNPGVVVADGATVTKGQKVGEVGESVHANNTQPHLHIDMRVGVNERVSCSGTGCAGFGFVNNQPLLTLAFTDDLPAN